MTEEKQSQDAIEKDVKQIEEEIKYIEQLTRLKKQGFNSEEAIAIMQELAKDRRIAEIETREIKTQRLATAKQKSFLDDLGIKYAENITKIEASKLITEANKKETEKGLG